MKTKVKKLICYFFGHNYDQVALEHGYLSCQRCDSYSHYDEDIKGEEFYNWRVKFWHIYFTWGIKEIFTKIKWKIKDFWKYKILRKDEDLDVPF